MAKTNPKSYEDALQELQEIVKALESRDVKIDDLTTKVSRAKELVDYCREKLTMTENQINKIIRPELKEEDTYDDDDFGIES